jgi:TolB-like protein/DNA-binding winged helix-turn-helix (wHTH) protein
MSGSRARAVYTIGGFRLDSGRRLLADARGNPIAITPKAFDALVHLAEHAGELVPRSALIEALWPQTVVEENNLNQAISSLRRVLGEGMIVTVPGRGYQLVAEVRVADAAPAAQESAVVPATPSSSVPRWLLAAGSGLALVLAVAAYFFLVPSATVLREQPTSIAVLPFVNLSSDAEQDYFVDGLSEDLMTRLARFDDLLVTARTSSFAFKGRTQDIATIGAQLGVEHVLEGSVDKAGNRLRIRASLLETAGGKRLWTESYERDLDDVFAVYDEISYAVAGALQVALNLDESVRPEGGTESVAAYEHYLFGRSLLRTWTPSYHEPMVAAFEKAIELDPDFGLARVALVNSYGQAAMWGIVPYAAALREEAFSRAVEMAPELPQTDILRAQQYAKQWQRAEADAHYRRALARLPNDYDAHTTYAGFLSGQGYMREALRHAEAAHRLDPLAMMNVHVMAVAVEALGDYDRAHSYYESTRSLVGNRNIPASEELFRLMSVGAFDEARALAQETRSSGPGNPVWDSGMALLEDPAAGRAALRKFYADPAYTDVSSVTGITRFAAHFGDAELAVAGLRKANEVSHALMPAIWGRSWQAVRADPAFKRFVTDIGLVAYWREAGWPDMCRPLGDDDFECS